MHWLGAMLVVTGFVVPFSLLITSMSEMSRRRGAVREEATREGVVAEPGGTLTDPH